MKLLAFVLGLLVVGIVMAANDAPAPAVQRDSKLYDTFCRSMAYEARRTAYFVVMGEAKRQEYVRMSPSERQSMWRLIGARVGCEF
jgi:hypothetical protein